MATIRPLFDSYEAALDHYYGLMNSEFEYVYPAILDLNLRGFLVLDYQRGTSSPNVTIDVERRRTRPIRIVEEHLYRDYLYGLMPYNNALDLYKALKRSGSIDRCIFSFTKAIAPERSDLDLPPLHRRSMISVHHIDDNGYTIEDNDPYKDFLGYSHESDPHFSHLTSKELITKLFDRSAPFVNDLCSVIIVDKYYSGRGCLYRGILDLI